MTLIRLEDIQSHKQSGAWRTLEKRAVAMVADAARHAGAAFTPHLGGGTRLMLLLEHRISDDIDLFIRDPQWIGYLSPRLNDDVGEAVNGYSENAVSLKLQYDEGEIDFIVGMSLLGLPEESSGDTPFLLEPVAEVLAKKLFYRGWALTPRDLFDWWCIERHMPDAIPVEKMARLLKTKFDEIERSLSGITKSPAAIGTWDAIRAVERLELGLVADWAKASLARYVDVANEITRRSADLPSLSNLAGAAYVFWKLANAEIKRSGSVDRVDWSVVELATVRESIGEHGQSPDAVADVLLKHSPGAVATSTQLALSAVVREVTPALQAAYDNKTRGLLDPSNGL